MIVVVAVWYLSLLLLTLLLSLLLPLLFSCKYSDIVAVVVVGDGRVQDPLAKTFIRGLAAWYVGFIQPKFDV